MEKRILLPFILFLTTVGYVATDIYLPSFPALTAYFNTTNTLVQLTLPGYLLSFALLSLLCGPYSDKVGRRKVILPGLVIGAIATIMIIFAQNIYLLILGRFFQGFGFGAVNVASRAMIADVYEGRDRAKLIAFMGMFIPIVLSCVPPLGGFLQEAYGWRMVFIALLSYVIILTIVSTKSLQETHVKLNDAAMGNFKQGYVALLTNKPFLAYAVIPSFTMMGINAYLTASPYLFQNVLGLSPQEYGYISIALGSMVILGSIINMRALNHFSSEKVLFVSVVFMLASGIALISLHFMNLIQIPYVIASCMIFFMCLNFAFANATALAFSQIDEGFGAATALIACSQTLSAMLISTFISFAPDNDVLPTASVFLFAGGCTLVCALIGHRLSQSASHAI